MQRMLMAVALIIVLSIIGLVFERSSRDTEAVVKKNIHSLSSIALDMVKAQTALEATDGIILTPAQVTRLEETMVNALSVKASGFDASRLGMKIEIVTARSRLQPSRELHRFGKWYCEPDMQLMLKVSELQRIQLLEEGIYPLFQVTMCYVNSDGSMTKSSASSLD
ncbi:hypothetical protein [Enterovibrio coralii]|uniref:Uncharacterized protein n=1 Tax=Enterovibrio coralii TaxID=294935 RepID=A0A135ICR3_9GAMM|nr:hypothetical protein [Enterovibrio coralii]KXF83229.1 hypothetical protein ATN88_05940 [Enterovibrio coralii]